MGWDGPRRLRGFLEIKSSKSASPCGRLRHLFPRNVGVSYKLLIITVLKGMTDLYVEGARERAEMRAAVRSDRARSLNGHESASVAGGL